MPSWKDSLLLFRVVFEVRYGLTERCLRSKVTFALSTKLRAWWQSLTIVDVTVPFENQHSAFAVTRKEKINKYAVVAEALRAKGYRVSIKAVITGSLGAWNLANEAILCDLRIVRWYVEVMRQVMCSDTIRWSKNIYVTFITGHQQWTRGTTEKGRGNLLPSCLLAVGMCCAPQRVGCLRTHVCNKCDKI